MKLTERWVEVKVKPHDLQGLGRVMFVTDPDGNFIESTREGSACRGDDEPHSLEPTHRRSISPVSR
jgi:hypothetical protein